MSHSPRTLLLTLLLASLCSTTAYADSNEEIMPAAPEPIANSDAVRVTLGMGFANVPRYVGSDQQRYRLMPTVSAVWKNGWFAGFPRGIGYNFSNDPGIEYGLRLTADMGRKTTSVSPALKGLTKVNARAELGPFLSYALTPQLKFNTALRYGSGNDSKGIVVEMGIRDRVPLDDKRFLTFGLSTAYANSNYMRNYFGVTAAQSASSGYAVYTPGAGIREVDLTASYTYQLDRQWAIVTGATLGRLGSTVTAAPMTRSNAHDSIYLQGNYTF